MYAIVRAGGRQEKVSVGDVLLIDKVAGAPGDSIDLTPLDRKSTRLNSSH